MAVIIAIPVILFSAAEMVGMMRRRRQKAMARRPKEPRQRPPSDVRSGWSG